ncbi:MAG: 3-phosphoserine/phosphohydroxythreonine transaminase [Chitinophagales bacterium]
MKKINFCAGPAMMPKTVFEQAAEAVLNYKNTGLSLLEISHRTHWFDEIIEGAFDIIRELLNLSDDYELLFLTGGASTQFYQVPYNLLAQTKTAAHLHTGRWADKALEEAKLFGNVEMIASAADKNFSYIPRIQKPTKDYAYLHITTNNTVCGTQMHEMPQVDCPIVADMSSDIFSKPIDVSPFGLIYAGVQKNMGPAGATLVIIRKDMLGKVQRQMPTMIDYRTHIKKKSIFNTPPVFPIYCSYLTLKWIKERGLAKIEADNIAKANLLYNELDRNALFEGTTARKDRSLMNVTFRGTNPNLDGDFMKFVAAENCIGLKGHRSMGGFRASIYNAMDISNVQNFVEILQRFEQKYG